MKVLNNYGQYIKYINHFIHDRESTSIINQQFLLSKNIQTPLNSFKFNHEINKACNHVL